MPIPHEEAQRLIQRNIDHLLSPNDKAMLSKHFEDCIECQTYARDMQEVENVLAPMLKRQWQHAPLPLSLNTLMQKRKSEASLFLVMRTALISVVVMAFVFSAWQFTASTRQAPDQSAVGILPIPTPSVRVTNTKTLQSCQQVVYTVQADDTLASIAKQFSVTKEQLVTYNQLKTELLRPQTQLMIPVCDFTPTGTIMTPLTRTYTPMISPTTSTPSG